MTLVKDLADTLRAVVAGRATGLPIETILPEVKAVLERAEATEWPAPGEDDRALPEDDAIDWAFPTRSGRHDIYAEAMRLVGARRSKGGLVALVNWLLLRIDVADDKAVREERARIVARIRQRAPMYQGPYTEQIREALRQIADDIETEDGT